MYDFAAEGVVVEAPEELGSRGACAGRIDRGLDWTGSGGRVMTEAFDEARRRRGAGGFVDIQTRRYRRGINGMDSARRRLGKCRDVGEHTSRCSENTANGSRNPVVRNYSARWNSLLCDLTKKWD
jgi:hypothetical protein